MAKPFGGKRPQDLRHTLRRFMDYLGRHKIMLGVVGLLAAVSALAALLGTYMIRPIVNGVLENGSAAYLAGVVALTAGIYAVGALSTLGYTQLMVRAAQKILQDIRRDLFAHLQTLPLHYFDTNRKGDLMSLFTNDVDTISDALNNSFAVVIQTFIQVAGTLLLLFILNWRLSLLVVVGYIAMFWYINYSTQRSRAYYARQQASLGELDAYMEDARQLLLPDMEEMNTQFIMSDETYGSAVLMTRMTARECDIYLLPKDLFQTYAQQGVFVALEETMPDLVSELESRGISLSRGWRTDSDTGEKHLFGIPCADLPYLDTFLYPTADSYYACIFRANGNEENVQAFFDYFIRDMLNVPPAEAAEEAAS